MKELLDENGRSDILEARKLAKNLYRSKATCLFFSVEERFIDFKFVEANL